jgi:hypothetical protein
MEALFVRVAEMERLARITYPTIFQYESFRVTSPLRKV